MSPTKPYYPSGYDQYKPAPHGTESKKKAVYFDTNLSQILTDMKRKESEQAQETLINDKPVPASIAMLRPLSDARKTRPNVYASPYNYGVNVSGVDITMDEDEEEWVEVKKPSGKGKDVATATTTTTTTVALDDEDVLDELEWVRVDIDRKKKKTVAFAPGAPLRQPIGPTPGAGAGFACAHGVGRGAGLGLAKAYYSARSTEERNLIDEEARKMGWYVGKKE
jgi:hypothetical protein